MSVKPIQPANWRLTKAIRHAKDPVIGLKKYSGGKAIPAFNGSQTSRRNKKRPITLPGGAS